MKITKALRKELEKYLPKNYRKIIVDRLAEKGIPIHPNTVRNTLMGNDNLIVATQLVKLSNEERVKSQKLQKEFDHNVQQLSEPALS